MSALGADVAFDFTFPSPSHEDPFAMDLAFDPSLLDLPYMRRHARSSSKASSIYSSVSTSLESTPDSVCTRVTTPPRASPPVHQHGPVLLPKIRHQDQHIDQYAGQQPVVAAARRSRVRVPARQRASSLKPAHARSYTNPETLANMAYAHLSSFALGSCTPLDDQTQSLVSSSSAELDAMSAVPRRASSACYGIDAASLKYTYPPYRHMSLMQTPPPDLSYSFVPRSQSPLSLDGSPEPVAPSTTLINYLMETNPAASLVRTVSFPMRDPGIRHFWWDIRSVRPWSLTARTIFSLPGASALLTTPVPAALLLPGAMSSRHPETEASLHAIYASYYLPKLNAALAMSSSRPLHLSVPAKPAKDMLFVANAQGESSCAAAMFGGKPSARVVGLVRSFDRFNTGMRVEGNVKRVEYLRGLAALHHAMREHSCRYGFILTEIEVVLVRCGTEATPFFGELEVTSVQLAVTADDEGAAETPLTACLALWGMCQLAGDEAPPGHPTWKTEIGAPAEGTRRKAKPRDSWMPQPQLAEKREAKRSRGWVWPEDAIGRKELGKRGVKYGGI